MKDEATDNILIERKRAGGSLYFKEENKTEKYKVKTDDIRLINEVNDIMLLNKLMSQLKLTEQCHGNKET